MASSTKRSDRSGHQIDWNTLYKETLEQCELADQVGFDNIWFVEHHFLTGFSGSPCPEVISGALSRITKRIRIGFGVCILPYHHPVRVAERVAMLDQLTDGRIEVGTGRSNAYEQTGLGIDPRDTRAMWEESITHDPQDLAVGRVLLGRPVLEGAAPARAAQTVPEAPSAACIWRARRQTASTWRPTRASACCPPPRTPRTSWPSTSSATATRVEQASPWAPSSTSSGATTSTPICGEDDNEARELAAQSLKTFFGPDKPYIRDRINAYEELLESWGACPTI